MFKIPKRSDTEMHFNRIVIAVMGDRTELRSCFHFVCLLDSFPHPLKKKSVYIPEMPEKFGRIKCHCPYLEARAIIESVAFFPGHSSLWTAGRLQIQCSVMSTSPPTHSRVTLGG